MPRLFINYRHRDVPEFAHALHRSLAKTFFDANVFIDDNLVPFVRVPDVFKKEVSESDVLIVVIGPHWLKLLQEREASGMPDAVRIEIESAIEADVQIAPILVHGAAFPTVSALPASLRPLSERLALPIRDEAALNQNINQYATYLRGLIYGFKSNIQDITPRPKRFYTVDSSQFVTQDEFEQSLVFIKTALDALAERATQTQTVETPKIKTGPLPSTPRVSPPPPIPNAHPQPIQTDTPGKARGFFLVMIILLALLFAGGFVLRAVQGSNSCTISPRGASTTLYLNASNSAYIRQVDNRARIDPKNQLWMGDHVWYFVWITISDPAQEPSTFVGWLDSNAVNATAPCARLPIYMGP